MAGRSKSDLPLHEAVAKSSTKDILAAFNKESLDIDAVDANGQTALHCAIWRRFMPGVKLLLKRGANVNAKDNNGRTPLHFGAKYCRMKMVEMFLAKGAKILARDMKGQTPLHTGSILPNNTDVVERLLISGTNVNVRDGLGRTPLHLAVTTRNYSYTSWDVVRILLDWGASVTVTDVEDETPLDTAVSRDSFVYMLKRHAIKCRAASFMWNLEYKSLNLSNFYIYETSCLEEVKRMKKVKFGQHFLYDIFYKYGDPTYLTNKKLKEAFNSSFLDSDYPNYASLLRATFERAKQRLILLDSAHQCFITFLPTEVVRNILSFVDDEDLENVIKANNGVT